MYVARLLPLFSILIFICLSVDNAKVFNFTKWFKVQAKYENLDLGEKKKSGLIVKGDVHLLLL